MGWFNNFSQGMISGGRNYHMQRQNRETGEFEDYKPQGTWASIGRGAAQAGTWVQDRERQGYERAKDVVDSAESLINPNNWLFYGAVGLGAYVLVQRAIAK